MRVILACFAIPLAISAALAVDHPGSRHHILAPRDSATGRGVAYFEAPRSVGTPVEDLARSYSGYGLADRIAGRFRLESDRTLNEAARQIIRRHLMQGS